MKSVRPKPFDVRALRLSAEEGFVLSRVDGPLSMRDLVALTGLEETRVNAIVDRLAEQGAIAVDGDAAPTSAHASSILAPFSHAVTDAGSDADTGTEADTDTDTDTDTDRQVERKVLEGEREYRRIYETVFRTMLREARIAAAHRVEGSQLMALCFDPEPQVILGIVSNPKAGLDHARTIAFHHRTAAGLEMCGRRTEFLADANVQRRLLKNPQLPDAVLRRLLHPKMLLDTYRISIDRENPERSRVKVREVLRKKFSLSSADERAALLVKTEGRALQILVGCPLDAHTTQILCGKTAYTILFVQNVARFSAAPPPLLAHLLKQPLVRRNPGLRKMLLQHHNTPADAKKNM